MSLTDNYLEHRLIVEDLVFETIIIMITGLKCLFCKMQGISKPIC